MADITYVRLRKEFVYLSVLMDVFTRCIRGWHLGRGLEQELTLTALERAFERGRPEIHHSDQGVQYAATAYVDMLKAREVQISMARVGEPEEKAYDSSCTSCVPSGRTSENRPRSDSFRP